MSIAAILAAASTAMSSGAAAGAGALATGTAATAATAGSVGLMNAVAAGVPGVLAASGLPTAATAATTGLFGTGGALALAPTLSTLGSIGSFVAPILAGNQAGDIAEANADLARMEARSKAESGRTAARKLSREANIMAGTQRAAIGKAGVAVEGSPLAVMADTAAQYGYDVAMTGQNASEAAKASMYEANIYSATAKNKRRSGWLQAGMSLLPTEEEAKLWG